MSFAPPPGPPPPKVPEGWKAQFDDRYKEWFYVNLSTGVSQWEKPSMPEEAPPGPPPSYDVSGSADPAAVSAASANEKKSSGALGSNNPYNTANPSNSSIDDDARLAAQLQAEEDAKSRGHTPNPSTSTSQGASSDYYNATSPPPAQQPSYASSSSPQPPEGQRGKSKDGFLGKLLGKANKHNSRPSQGQGYPPPQQQYAPYGGYPPQQPGFYPQQPGFYPQQQPYGYAQPPPRRGGGMGAGGAAALGVGGGLLGGMLLADAMDDNDYGDGYQDGFDDAGGDFGGGDF